MVSRSLQTIPETMPLPPLLLQMLLLPLPPPPLQPVCHLRRRRHSSDPR